MRSKLGQLSVETMIIYGLVILVALSVIAGLLYFNVLDIGSYLPATCDLGGTGDLKCEEFSFAPAVPPATGGVLQLGIRNIGQKPISSLGVTVDDSDDLHFATTPSGQGTVGGGQIGTSLSLAPGDIALVNIPTPGIKSGKLLRAKLTTDYMFKDGVVTQTSVGTLRVKASG